MLTALVSSIWMLGAATPAAARPLFSDPLDGSAPLSAWRTPTSTSVDLPEGGRAPRFSRGTTWESTGQPWVGDESWSSYRIEVEVRPEKMWGGVDFQVGNDGRTGCEVTVVEGGGGRLFFEASGLWDLASAWKLWPVGQRTIPHAAGGWVRLHIDVGPDLTNVFANDDP